MSPPAPYRYLAPCNALTYGSLCAGILAVLAASEFRSWHGAGACLTLSVFLDTVDGRFARLFPRTADEAAFGVQLDSLTDAVVFGFVPIVCLGHLLDFGSVPGLRIGWFVAASAYLVCAVTRLGCYNLHQSGSGQFRGVPTTLAALILTTLFLTRLSALWAVLALVVCAAAMVAPIPVPRPRGRAFAIFSLWILVVLFGHTLGVMGHRDGTFESGALESRAGAAPAGEHPLHGLPAAPLAAGGRGGAP